MRLVKLTFGLLAIFSTTALASASAFAAETLWPWLPGKDNTKFTGNGKKTLFETKAGQKIECASFSILTGEGLLTIEKTLGLAVIHFLGCKTSGLPINSVGDEKEIILAHVDLHNCTIAAGDFGILLTLLPLHLTIPITALLIVLDGSFIALVLAPNILKLEHKLNIKQTKGKQEIEKCEGGSKDTLLFNDDEKGAEELGVEVQEEASIVFAVAQTAML